MKLNKNQTSLLASISSRSKRNLPKQNTLVNKLRPAFSINTKTELRIRIVPSPMTQF